MERVELYPAGASEGFRQEGHMFPEFSERLSDGRREKELEFHNI